MTPEERHEAVERIARIFDVPSRLLGSPRLSVRYRARWAVKRWAHGVGLVYSPSVQYMVGEAAFRRRWYSLTWDPQWRA